MPETDHKLKSYEVWLKHAKGDLAIACVDGEGILAESRCFHAQQAVEKALKAIIIACGKEITKTHRIDQIIEQIPQEIEIPSFIEAGVYLTVYAVSARYPSKMSDLSEDDWKEAVKIARKIYEWAENTIVHITSKK